MIRCVLTAALLAAMLAPLGCGADGDSRTPGPGPDTDPSGGEGAVPGETFDPGIRPRPGFGGEELPIAEEREGDGWRWVLYRTNAGTRSEGSLGRLWRDGEEVSGRPGDALETPLGSFGFVEGVNLWDARGWLPGGGAEEGGPGQTRPR